MNARSPQAPANAIGRYKTYGLFGGAALGSVVGVLMSGPNFFVWAPAQSVGLIGGLAVGMGLIGYLFVGLVVGGFAGGGGQGEISGSGGGGNAGDGAAGGGDD